MVIYLFSFFIYIDDEVMVVWRICEKIVFVIGIVVFFIFFWIDIFY